jgi:hypothetical protein
MQVQNPFFHRGPIRDRAYFFDREPEARQVLSLLGNGQSVSLVGQRRIGKTSLLFHLAEAQVFTQYGLNAEEHLFVYIDCGGLSDLDQPNLYRVFLEEIDDALAVEASAQRLQILDGDLSYRSFERMLRQLIRQNRKPIILLDEFERMSLNPQLDPDFFSGLRALGLGLLAEAEAGNLVTKLAATAQVNYGPDTITVILNLAGPHPFFLQIAGFHAFELQQLKGLPLTANDHPELRHRFNAAVAEHFGYYWHNLTDAEQYVLATLPASQDSRPDIALRLEQACLIRRHQAGYDYLSPTFRDFVQAQAITGLLQAGLLAIDKDQHQALLRGQPLNLTATQYSLLLHLVEQAGQVVSTAALEQAIWADEYIEDPERLKSVIKGLRKALGDESTRLENVRGVGYLWRA